MWISFRLFLLLGLIIGIQSDTVKRQADGWDQTNSMSLEPNEAHDDLITSTKNIYIDGSGDMEMSGAGLDDDDSEEASGEESPDLELTPSPPAHHPSTTTQRAKPVRTKKPGKPDRPDRPDPEDNRPDDKSGPKTRRPEKPPHRPTPHPNDIGQPSKKMPTDGGVTTQLSNILRANSQPSFTQKLFESPAYIAAIICGGVIVLLVSIILVMFIVYRLKKKDQGSYELDEPKKAKDPNVYQKDTAKEFYA